MSAELPVTELVDLMSLSHEGPCVVFIRPRRELTPEEQANVDGFCGMLHIPGIVFVTMPHDFDLMVIGEAELKAVGLARIP